MMPTIEPTLPIRELPDEVEAAIITIRGNLTWVPLDNREQWADSLVNELRHAIRAALDDEWDKGFRQAVTDHVELVENIKALRERGERLRRVALLVNASAEIHAKPRDLYMSDAFFEALRLGDLADDLRPRGEDMLP